VVFFDGLKLLDVAQINGHHTFCRIMIVVSYDAMLNRNA
jgi:hypothetical protein